MKTLYFMKILLSKNYEREKSFIEFSKQDFRG